MWVDTLPGGITGPVELDPYFSFPSTGTVWGTYQVTRQLGASARFIWGEQGNLIKQKPDSNYWWFNEDYFVTKWYVGILYSLVVK